MSEYDIKIKSDLEKLFKAIAYCVKVGGDDDTIDCDKCPTGADYKLCGVALNTVYSMQAIGRLGGCKQDEPV